MLIPIISPSLMIGRWITILATFCVFGDFANANSMALFNRQSYSSRKNLKEHGPPIIVRVEYLDLLQGRQIDLDIARDQLIKILAGKAKIFVFIDNSPKNFKRLGRLKQDKTESKKNDTRAFDLSNTIKSQYEQRSDMDFSLTIQHEAEEKLKLKFSQKKIEIIDWL